MDRRRSTRAWIAAGLAGVSLISGCAQPGPFSRHRTTMGALKASVASLESEKDHLERQLADQKTSNRRLEETLAMERDANNEMTTRLDDARNLIRRQGFDDSVLGSNKTDSEIEAFSSGPRRTTPASRPKNRKAPFAEIRGEIRPAPKENANDEDVPFNTRESLEDDTAWRSASPSSRRK